MYLDNKFAFDYLNMYTTEGLTKKTWRILKEEGFPVNNDMSLFAIRHIIEELFSVLQVKKQRETNTLLLCYWGSTYENIDDRQESYPRFIFLSKNRLHEFKEIPYFEKLTYYGDSTAIVDLSPLETLNAACLATLPKGDPWVWENLQIFFAEVISELNGFEETFCLTLLARFVAFKMGWITRNSEEHVHSSFKPSRFDSLNEVGISEEKLAWLKFDYLWNKLGQYRVYRTASIHLHTCQIGKK